MHLVLSLEMRAKHPPLQGVSRMTEQGIEKNNHSKKLKLKKKKKKSCWCDSQDRTQKL
jgi:hypothetical protein